MKHKISQGDKKCLSGSLSCHILHRMIEYRLTKKKIFEQKYEESTQDREDIRHKSTVVELAEHAQASASSHNGWEETE